MKYEEFIEQVQKRAHLSSPSEAQRATQATLETLTVYMSLKERHDAASQLPKGVPAYGKAEKNLDGGHELQPS
jgi:uncharacterized protein (DUF2267 family)